MGEAVQIVGDDLTVTNIDFIKKAVDEKAANCLLLKVNQVNIHHTGLLQPPLSKTTYNTKALHTCHLRARCALLVEYTR